MSTGSARKGESAWHRMSVSSAVGYDQGHKSKIDVLAVGPVPSLAVDTTDCAREIGEPTLGGSEEGQGPTESAASAARSAGWTRRTRDQVFTVCSNICTTSNQHDWHARCIHPANKTLKMR